MKTILVVLAVILMSFIIVSCSCGGTTTSVPSNTPPYTLTPSSPVPTSTAAATTLAVPPPTSTAFNIGEVDMATYRKYFTELGIGLMTNGAKNPWEDLQKNASIFKFNDLLAFYGETILECQPGIKVYSMDSETIVQDTSLPYSILGPMLNWNSVTYSTGYYLYCVYIGDVLVGKYNFQVTE